MISCWRLATTIQIQIQTDVCRFDRLRLPGGLSFPHTGYCITVAKLIGLGLGIGIGLGLGLALSAVCGNLSPPGNLSLSKRQTSVWIWIWIVVANLQQDITATGYHVFYLYY